MLAHRFRFRLTAPHKRCLLRSLSTVLFEFNYFGRRHGFWVLESEEWAFPWADSVLRSNLLMLDRVVSIAALCTEVRDNWPILLQWVNRKRHASFVRSWATVLLFLLLLALSPQGSGVWAFSNWVLSYLHGIHLVSLDMLLFVIFELIVLRKCRVPFLL